MKNFTLATVILKGHCDMQEATAADQTRAGGNTDQGGDSRN